MVPGTDVVWLYDPNDIAIVLNDNTPGTYPQRRSHLTLLKYRLDKPQVYKTGGLLPTWVTLQKKLLI
jgi:ecdysteroid 22-hydroxylase